VTGLKYVDTLKNPESASEADKLPPEEIRALSIKFGEEVHRRGLRVMWDPQFARMVGED
jgi:hypothetical protein